MVPFLVRGAAGRKSERAGVVLLSSVGGTIAAAVRPDLLSPRLTIALVGVRLDFFSS